MRALLIGTVLLICAGNVPVAGGGTPPPLVISVALLQDTSSDADSLLKQAYDLKTQRKRDEARALFERLVRDYPTTSAGVEARWMVAYYLLNDKQFDETHRLFQQVASDALAKPDIAAEALLQTGFAYISRYWAEANAPGEQRYKYDGEELACELDAAGNVAAPIIFGANGLLVYGRTAYQFDPQGNAVHLLNDDGRTVLANFAYDAWGQLMSGSNPTPYGYKGQWGYYTDAESGILLLTHRYLDPATGKFLTRDPIGLEGGVNLYAYVGNGVVVNQDPSGHLIIPACVVGGGLAYWAYDCWETAKQVQEECDQWRHKHGRTPRGGDKLVHCVAACLIGLRAKAGIACAWLAARSTGRGGNPFGRLIDDPLDEKAALDGVDCATSLKRGFVVEGKRIRRVGTGNDWLDCQKCCHDKGYRRWK